MGKWKGIIGKSFSAEQFREYVNSLSWGDWTPDFIVLHHTAEPSLAQRPQGLTVQHIKNLEKYYRDEVQNPDGSRGWSAGPHLFVDDRQIWVFTPPTTTGVHAKSFNSRSLGFDSGRGGKVRDNAVAAIAILSKSLGLDHESLMFHREEPGTTKTCPGELVDKDEVIQRVKDYLGQVKEAPAPASNIKPEEFDLARERLPIFQAAADAYRWPEELEAAMFKAMGADWMKYVLMGIDSRESRFGLLLDEDGNGDHGHGCGELQIDDRWHDSFCSSGKWRDLAASLDYVHRNVIIPSFNDLGDKCFGLLGEDYEALFWATVAAYNCGAGNVRKALEAGQGIDAKTTGKDYSRDVQARALVLKEAMG
jgi:hypothetical protein